MSCLNMVDAEMDLFFSHAEGITSETLHYIVVYSDCVLCMGLVLPVLSVTAAAAPLQTELALTESDSPLYSGSWD